MPGRVGAPPEPGDAQRVLARPVPGRGQLAPATDSNALRGRAWGPSRKNGQDSVHDTFGDSNWSCDIVVSLFIQGTKPVSRLEDGPYRDGKSIRRSSVSEP